MHNKWQMDGWELTKEENGWHEVSTNLVHFPISAIVVLQIQHAEEFTIILGLLCWHIDIRNNLFWNIRERRSSKQLKNFVKPSTDLNRNDRVMSVLVIILFPILRIQNFNLFVDFIDTIHSPMCIVEHMYEYLLKKWLSYKNGIQMNCKQCIRIQQW
jgi:hypothetical protein